jgi:hypothetical protein
VIFFSTETEKPVCDEPASFFQILFRWPAYVTTGIARFRCCIEHAPQQPVSNKQNSQGAPYFSPACMPVRSATMKSCALTYRKLSLNKGPALTSVSPHATFAISYITQSFLPPPLAAQAWRSACRSNPLSSSIFFSTAPRSEFLAPTVHSCMLCARRLVGAFCCGRAGRLVSSPPTPPTHTNRNAPIVALALAPCP